MKRKITLSEEDQTLFRQLMVGTRKIRQDMIVHRPQRKKVSEVPVKRLTREQADTSRYFSDEFQPLLDTEGPVKYVRSDVSHLGAKKLRHGDYSPELFLDLRGLTQLQVKQELGALVATCHREHMFCACVIHGHGKYASKQQTPLWLAQHPHVMAFHQVPREYDGDAALLVLIGVDERLPPELPRIFKGGRVCPFSLECWRPTPGGNERNNRVLIGRHKQLSDSFCGLMALTLQRGLRMTTCYRRSSTNYSSPSTAI